MTITKDIIKSVADIYTVDQLREKIITIIHDMETNGSTIVSASTGAGASYTRRIEASREDLLALYQAALNFKIGIVAKTGEFSHVAFHSPFNR